MVCFNTGITDDDLRETAYEILLAAAGASGYLSFCILVCTFVAILITDDFPFHMFICTNRGLIVPSKEKKKEKKSRLMRKLGRSKSEHVMQSQNSPGLVGLLETMRVQMEVNYTYSRKHFPDSFGSLFLLLT